MKRTSGNVNLAKTISLLLIVIVLIPFKRNPNLNVAKASSLGTTTLVSIHSNGSLGNGASYIPAISADGRYVTFHSEASNLVDGDTNGAADIFLHDTQIGETTRVSVASNGSEGNNGSWQPDLSADGRYVVFDSLASNLVDGDTNGTWDVFLHDTQIGETTRVSVASDGSQGNDGSWQPVLSADGRYVAFHSFASNLVDGDTNDTDDVFLHDTQTGDTIRVSVASDGSQGNGTSHIPTLSAKGRFVAFESRASNLVGGDTNGIYDVFLHDTQTGQTTRVSVASDGSQGDGDSWKAVLSADGRYVEFSSEATNLVDGDTNGTGDIFLHDTQTGETRRVSVASDGSQGNGGSYGNALSADGHYFAFHSYASNLVDGDTNGVSDIFVFELSPRFGDVPFDHWAYDYIEAVYLSGITGECSTDPVLYCPSDTVTRAQMAVFLERGIHGSDYSPPAPTGIFDDVPVDYWAAKWVEALYNDGITGGCGGNNYCPGDPVTRAQMAVFLLRSEHGSAYDPPAATGVFNDVPVDYWAADWIEQLAAEGITGGCGDGNYCPEDSVTRDQMAVFLVRTFDLSMP